MAAFDRLVGLDRIKAFHLNDSRRELGSRIDRHEHIGRGRLGLEAFRLLLVRSAIPRRADVFGDSQGGGRRGRPRRRESAGAAELHRNVASRQAARGFANRLSGVTDPHRLYYRHGRRPEAETPLVSIQPANAADLCDALRFRLLLVRREDAAGKEAAMRWLRRFGSWAVSRATTFNSKGRRTRSPPGPAWLRTLLGDDLFSDVTEVFLGESRITDNELICLKGLPRLKKLVLGKTQVTDAGLKHLEGLTQLEDLSLSRTRVTDAGLVHLKAMTQLQTLWLAGTQVTAWDLCILEG